MRLLRREVGPGVEAMSGIGVACFRIGFGTLGVFVRHSTLSIFASVIVLVWAGWISRTCMQLLRAGR